MTSYPFKICFQQVFTTRERDVDVDVERVPCASCIVLVIWGWKVWGDIWKNGLYKTPRKEVESQGRVESIHAICVVRKCRREINWGVILRTLHKMTDVEQIDKLIDNSQQRTAAAGIRCVPKNIGSWCCENRKNFWCRRVLRVVSCLLKCLDIFGCNVFFFLCDDI